MNMSSSGMAAAFIEEGHLQLPPEAVGKLPDKSRSLRLRSIQKRLETERRSGGSSNGNSSVPRAQPPQDPRFRSAASTAAATPRSRAGTGRSFRKAGGCSTVMSKYRRKTANAKERDRMKTVNDAFERLKAAVPATIAQQQQQEDQGLEHQGQVLSAEEALPAALKSTKVSTLRCAIAYINALRQLIDDSEKGLVDPKYYSGQEPSPTDPGALEDLPDSPSASLMSSSRRGCFRKGPRKQRPTNGQRPKKQRPSGKRSPPGRKVTSKVATGVRAVSSAKVFSGGVHPLEAWPLSAARPRPQQPLLVQGQVAAPCQGSAGVRFSPVPSLVRDINDDDVDDVVVKVNPAQPLVGSYPEKLSPPEIDRLLSSIAVHGHHHHHHHRVVVLQPLEAPPVPAAVPPHYVLSPPPSNSSSSYSSDVDTTTNLSLSPPPPFPDGLQHWGNGGTGSLSPPGCGRDDAFYHHHHHHLYNHNNHHHQQAHLSMMVPQQQQQQQLQCLTVQTSSAGHPPPGAVLPTTQSLGRCLTAAGINTGDNHKLTMASSSTTSTSSYCSENEILDDIQQVLKDAENFDLFV